MKILISLISDQQIPNVLFIKEMNPDINIFVTTDSMEKKGQSNKLINTLNLGINSVKRILVNPENFDDVISKLLKEVKINDEDELVINITGGTKIMSIASYYFGRRKGAKIYYLPIGSNRLIKIFPDTEPKEREIKFSLSLREYLNAYFRLEDREYFKFGSLQRGEEEAERMMELYINGKLNKIIDLIREKNGRKNNIEVNGEIEVLLKEINFVTNDRKILLKYESKYITGGWFEEWVYYKIKRVFNLSDEYIAIGVNRNETDTTVQNDFDVMFTVKNKLGIIECKTSLEEDGKEYALFQETLYKSASLVRDFGLNPVSFLFTLSPKPQNKQKMEEMNKRAKYFNITCFYREDFLGENFSNTLEEIKKKFL